MRRSPFQTRCILCCCPCCFGGLSRSLQEFVQSGAVWSLTFWITCLDIAVFLVEIGLGGVAAVDENPMLGPSACLLIRMQAKWSPAIVHRFQLWRLVVPMFLHSGFVHIFINLYTQARRRPPGPAARPRNRPRLAAPARPRKRDAAQVLLFEGAAAAAAAIGRDSRRESHLS